MSKVFKSMVSERSTMVSTRFTMVSGRSTMVLGRSTTVSGRSTIVLGRSTMVLGRSTMVLGRSGLDFSGLGGQGEPGESHQESVTTYQTDKQPGDYRAFPDFEESGVPQCQVPRSNGLGITVLRKRIAH